MARRVAGHALRPGRAGCASARARRGVPWRLHHEPPSHRRGQRTGVHRVRIRRQAASARSWRSGAARRAASLFLEEREMDPCDPNRGRRPGRVLGVQRLSHPRRSVEGAALQRRPVNPLVWQIATVRQIRPETAKVKSFTFALPEWTRHRAGQHYDLRLTAPDGYRAQRSYSIASAPEREGQIDLTIERVEDGEVSTFLHETVVIGDRVELRGPIGGYFVWEAAQRAPLLLVAGGSGVVPMMSMLRHRAAARSPSAARLLFSSRTIDDVIYRAELEALVAR